MSVLTLILAGGEGNRLSILGEKRAKPAVPFGGKYRIIDFPLSNVVNAELYRIAVLTQNRPHSLMQHLGIGEPWDLNRRWPNGIQIW
jgi:glucose-1-phosphate adenylyltransferase